MRPAIFEIAERARERHGMTLRHMTRRSLRRDLDLFAEVYNAAWAGNWGFVPYSKEDLDAYALDLQLVFDPKWFMVVETRDGDVAGVAISPLDVNQVLQQHERAAAADRLGRLPATARRSSTASASASWA